MTKILNLLRTKEVSLSKKVIQHLLENYDTKSKAEYRDILSEIEQQLLDKDLMDKKIIS